MHTGCLGLACQDVLRFIGRRIEVRRTPLFFLLQIANSTVRCECGKLVLEAGADNLHDPSLKPTWAVSEE